MKIDYDDDEGFVITLHQSDIATYLTCPERARQLWQGRAEDSTSGEAAVGTAFHLAVERFRGGNPPGEALEAATEALRGLTEQPGFRWVKVKTLGTAQKHLATCWRSWLANIHPVMGEHLAIEHKFDIPFATTLVTLRSGTSHKVHIRLAGTIDFVEEYGTVVDWKTCSNIRKYTTEGWQLVKRGIQPTVYTWAVRNLGLTDLYPVPFTWAAVERASGKHAFLTCTRDIGDWGWLDHICLNIVDTWFNGGSTWPVNDQHGLCSADWCPAWNDCKGVYITPSPSAGDNNVHVSLYRLAGT